MAGEAKETEALDLEPKATAEDIESKIQTAMYSLVSHFKEQADSLTFEGVRRLLEKDLGLELYTLDVHKRYIKQCLVKCLDGTDDDNASKNTKETGMKDASGVETANTLDLHHPKNVKQSYSEDEEKVEDSPVIGQLTGKIMKIEYEGIKGHGKKEVPSESTIKKAIRKRLSYIKANTEKVTMAGLRRTLEDDLGLTKFTLDTCKKFISQQIEEMLNSFQVSKPATKARKSSVSKAFKKFSSDGDSESVESESSEEENGKVRKKNVPKRKSQNSDGLKKRKRPQTETISSKKHSKPQKMSEVNSDQENSGDVSENSEEGQSQSSTEKPVKKKEASTPVYGKRVEHLKSIIKSCGMSVPPSVYKKVKQASDNKREGQLVKELQEILSREGLSENPSEKDIKEVRKKKEKAKELEGIDVSNIVSSTRRRCTTNFIAPPKPKAPVESDDEESNSNSDGDNDVEDEEEDAEDNGGGHDSQNEELNEDDEENDSD